jgi:hypothetical protein
MILLTWATRHNVSPQALTELRQLLDADSFMPEPVGDLSSETGVQNKVRLDASKAGHRLWRNNVGVLKDARGIPVRFGLANDSANVNAKIKSGDLIGMKRILITPEHVGHIIGQFWSVECKHAGWKYRGDAREEAQLRWINTIIALGGCASFTTGQI